MIRVIRVDSDETPGPRLGLNSRLGEQIFFGYLLSVISEHTSMLLKGESQLPDLQGPRSYVQRLMFRRECLGLGKSDKEDALAAINEKKQMCTHARANDITAHEANDLIDQHANKSEATRLEDTKGSVNRADFSNLKREDESEYRSARRKKSNISLTVGACHPSKICDRSYHESENLETKKPCWKACYVSNFYTARDFDRMFRDRLFRQVTGLNDDPSERKLFTDCRRWSLYDAVAEANDLSLPFAQGGSRTAADWTQQLGARGQQLPVQSISRIDRFVKGSTSRHSNADGAEPAEHPRLNRRRHSASAEVAQQLYAPFKDTVLDFEVNSNGSKRRISPLHILYRTPHSQTTPPVISTFRPITPSSLCQPLPPPPSPFLAPHPLTLL